MHFFAVTRAMACLGDAGVLCVFILIGVAPNAKQVSQVRLVEWVTHIAVILEPRKKVAAHQDVQAFENDLCGLVLGGSVSLLLRK